MNRTNIDSHKRLLSILHIVFGIATIMIFLVINTVFGSLSPFIASEINRAEGPEGAALFELVTGMVHTFVIFILIFIPLPSIVGGIAFYYKKDWGIVLMMVSGCLSLLSFPLGTALGIYTIWVFLNYRKEQVKHDTNTQ